MCMCMYLYKSIIIIMNYECNYYCIINGLLLHYTIRCDFPNSRRWASKSRNCVLQCIYYCTILGILIFKWRTLYMVTWHVDPQTRKKNKQKIGKQKKKNAECKFISLTEWNFVWIFQMKEKSFNVCAWMNRLEPDIDYNFSFKMNNDEEKDKKKLH